MCYMRELYFIGFMSYLEATCAIQVYTFLSDSGALGKKGTFSVVHWIGLQEEDWGLTFKALFFNLIDLGPELLCVSVSWLGEGELVL